MTAKTKTPRPPASLGEAGRKYWRTVCETFILEGHHVDILRSACEQLDRANSARAEIQSNGVVVLDRFGQPKASPAVEIERQAHSTFLKLARELGLDVAPPESRGPRRPGTGR